MAGLSSLTDMQYFWNFWTSSPLLPAFDTDGSRGETTQPPWQASPLTCTALLPRVQTTKESKPSSFPEPRLGIQPPIYPIPVGREAGLGSILDTESKDTEDTAPLVSVS